MGGRGRNYNKSNKSDQMNMEQAIAKNEVNQILAETRNLNQGTAIGADMGNGSTGGFARKKCACCGEYSLIYGIPHQQCSICEWIDDEYQNQHPDSLDGPNSITLREARKAYQMSHG